MTDARISHSSVEVLGRATAAGQVSAVAVEVLVRHVNQLVVQEILACQVPLPSLQGAEPVPMTNRSHTGYGGDPWGGQGRLKRRTVTPVQFETVEHLGGTQLGDGRCLLYWRVPGSRSGDPGSARAAVVASLNHAMHDGSVQPESAFTVPTVAAGSAYSHSMWFHNGQLHQFLCGRSGNNCVLQHWTATDPSNPAGTWTLRSTVQTAEAPASARLLGSGGSGGEMMGTPLVLRDTGRWILPVLWPTSFQGHADRNAGIITSDDNGQTWVLRFSGRGFAFQLLHISPTVGRDPNTGYLYWYLTTGPVGRWMILGSQDNGTTWGVAHSADTQRAGAFYGDDGRNLFAADYGSFDWRGDNWLRRGEHVVINPTLYDTVASYLELDIGGDSESVYLHNGLRVCEFPHVDTEVSAVIDSWRLENSSGSWRLENSSGHWLRETQRMFQFPVYRDTTFVLFFGATMAAPDPLLGEMRMR